jgi:UDP-N-acetylglucosamine diphosphorylase/glucosamine-1-phosphate N-acetyltransferase
MARKFPQYEIILACRKELAELVRVRTGKTVNRLDYKEGDRLIFINGRLRLGKKLIQELKTIDSNIIYHQNRNTAALVITDSAQNVPLENLHFNKQEMSTALGVKVDIAEGEFEFYNYLWDLINLNGNEIGVDYLEISQKGNLEEMLNWSRIDSSVRILSENNLYLARGAEIGAGAVIDNRPGPVIIDERAVIGPLSLIEGPCYIGKETRIFRGNIREGCSFGPACRIGGEVEESIFQGFTNKYHDGFMGHAYLGSWVNLGAMTTNSDLKNNYKNIDVVLNGNKVETGSMKIGSFIGDHTKTGIGTLINTGVNIGFSCNIFGGTLVTMKEIPSFSWGDESGYDIYRLDRALEVAKKAMSRRNITVADHDEELFRMIYRSTHNEG